MAGVQPLHVECVEGQQGWPLPSEWLNFINMVKIIEVVANSLLQSLKGTYYENNTFPGIWGVVLSLLLPHAHRL